MTAPLRAHRLHSSTAPRMRVSALKNVGVLLVGALLAALGIYNIVLKATWTLMDDGVYWRDSPQGIVAGRVAGGGPASLAGVQVGDVLMALDGEEVLHAEQVPDRLEHRAAGARISYTLLRAEERRALVLEVRP